MKHETASLREACIIVLHTTECYLKSHMHASVCIILLQYVMPYPISCDDAIRGLGCLPLNSEGVASSSSYHDIPRRRGGYKKEEKKITNVSEELSIATH